MANLEMITFLTRVLEVGKIKLDRKKVTVFEELMIINVCKAAYKYKEMLESAEQEQEEFSPVASEPEQEQAQEPEQASPPQFTPEETIDFVPYDEEADDFYSSPADESTSDEDSLSPPSMGSDYEYNSALYAAMIDDVDYQNEYASSNQDDVPESLDCDDADYLSSNGTYESESDYIDLASLTPTASQFSDMIYRAHADKDDSSSYEINTTFDDSLECTQNNVTIINSLNVAATTTTPSSPISTPLDAVSGNSTTKTNTSNVVNEDKENKPTYSSRLKSKHGRSFGADVSENAPKQRKLGGSVSMNDSNSTKANKSQGTTSLKRTGLGCLDNQSTQRINKSSDTARKNTTRSNALQDLENQPVDTAKLAPTGQKQSLQQPTSKSSSKVAPVATTASQPTLQQATNKVPTVKAPKYTTVSVLGKKRTRHERDEYDFYSDYHRPEAKRLFNELLSKDPF